MATFRVVSSTHATRSATAKTVTVSRPGTLVGGDLLLAFQFFGAEQATPTPLATFTNYQRGQLTQSGFRTTRTYYQTVTHPTPTNPTDTVTTSGFITVRHYYTETLAGWQMTVATYTPTITPSAWVTTATFVIVLALSLPAVVGTAKNIEAMVTKSNSPSGVSSQTLKVSPDLASDIVILGVVQKTSGSTITFPGGTTTVATSTTNVSAGVGYLVPGTGAHTETISMSKSSPMGSFAVVITDAVGPTLPTLTAPASTRILAVTTGVAFTAVYHNAAGAPQSAYALRIRTATSLSWQYWNATTASLQSSVIYNANATTPGKSWTVTLPSTTLANNKQYIWSMSSKTSVVSQTSAFATTFTFTTAAVPTVSVTAPTGSDVSTAHPLVKFNWTTAPTFVLTRVRVVVYTQAQHTAATFTPGASPSYWDSGTVA